MPPAPHDTLPLRRLVIAAVAAVVALWVGTQIPEKPFYAVALLGSLAYLFTAGVNYRWLAWLVIALQPAALIVPFFPGRPLAWEFAAMLSWPSLAAAFLIDRTRLQKLSFDRLEITAMASLVGYLLVLLLLMMVRGVGFRALGGDQMGGKFYVQQIILVIVPTLLVAANPTRRALLWAVAIGWCLSLTYLVSDLALVEGGRLWWLLQFFELPTDAVNFYLNYESSGVRRIQSLWFVGAAMLSAAATLMPLRDAIGKKLWLGLPLICGGFVLGLASGHRTALLYAVLFFLILGGFQRFWTPLRTLTIAGVLALVVVGLASFVTELPLAVQRSVSFIPGIKISGMAESSAYDTLRDRWEILNLAIKDLPNYWLIGRGFGIERFDPYGADAFGDNLAQLYASGSFYNGFLGSLIKTGVPGLLCTLVFFFCVCKMAVELVGRIRRRPAGEWTTFERFAVLMCAQWFSLLVVFYFLHGDAGFWAHTFIFPAAIVMLCRHQLRQPEPVESARV